MASTSRHIAELIIRLKDELSGNAENARQRIAQLEKQINNVSSMALSFAGKISAIAAPLVLLGRRAVQVASQLQDLSDQTGLSAEFLSQIKTPVEEAGSSIDSFARGIFNLQKTLGSIDQATDPAAQALKRLGLDVREIFSMSPEEFTKKLIDAFSNIQNPIERSTLLFQLLGKQARELGPAFENLAKGMKNAGLSSEEIQRLDELGDMFTRLWNRVVLGSMEALASLLRFFNIASTERDKLKNDLADIDKQIEQIERRREFIERRFGGQALRPNIEADLQRQLQKDANKREELLKQRQQIEQQLRELDKPKPRAQPPKQKENIFEIAELHPFAQRLRQSLAAGEKIDIERATKHLAELTKKAVGDLYDYLDQADKDHGQQIASNRDQELKREIEFIEQMRELLLTQLYEPWDRLDKEFMDERLRAREEEIERNRGIAEIFQTLRTRSATREKLAPIFGTDTAGQIRDVRSAIEDLVDKGIDPTDERVQELKKRFDELSRVQDIERVIGGALNGITTSLQGVMLGTQSVGQAFRNMAQNVLMSLTDIIVKLTIVEPLIESLKDAMSNTKKSSGGGGVSGFLGGIFGFIGNLLGFQEGGIVPGPVGMPRLAVVHGGEEVIPAHAPARAVVNYFIDARGAERGVGREIRREIEMSRKRAVAEAVVRVKEERQRSDRFARIFSK